MTKYTVALIIHRVQIKQLWRFSLRSSEPLSTMRIREVKRVSLGVKQWPGDAKMH